MPKTALSFNPGEYALVADRITLFYERYPTGRIITKLVSHDRDIVVRAAAYRNADDKYPAATGLASERVGNGDINTVACLENTETSAIGRALANLGFTASRKRPSREEMEKAERVRARGLRVAENAPVRLQERATSPPRVTAPAPTAVDQTVSHARPGDRSDVRDALFLVDFAERAGMPPRRASFLRSRLGSVHLDDSTVTRLTRRLRRWIAARHERVFGTR